MLLSYVTFQSKYVLRKQARFYCSHFIPITLQKLTTVVMEITAQQSMEHNVNNVCQDNHF